MAGRCALHAHAHHTVHYTPHTLATRLLLPLAIHLDDEAATLVDPQHTPRAEAAPLAAVVQHAVCNLQRARLSLERALVELEERQLLLGRESVEARHLRLVGWSKL